MPEHTGKRRRGMFEVDEKVVADVNNCLEYDGEESHRSRPRLTTSQQTLLRLRREVVELGEPVSVLMCVEG
jgi:hypothetical protein